MLIPHKTLIALVDGRNLELYRNHGNETEPALEALPSPALDIHNKGSGGRHYASAGNPDYRLLEEDAHAAAVAEWLNQQVLGHHCDTLVVIAAPRTLGEMRKHYHKQTEQVLHGEFAKDLVGRPPHDIIAALRAT